MKYTKKSGLALIPFLVFIVIYLGAGLIYQARGEAMAFYMFPSVTAMFIAVLVAFCMSKGSINEKFETFAKGAANVDVLTMLIIYILAGAFATVAAQMGAKDATVNLGLSLVPPSLLASGSSSSPRTSKSKRIKEKKRRGCAAHPLLFYCYERDDV